MKTLIQFEKIAIINSNSISFQQMMFEKDYMIVKENFF